ncbi:unnamed protein product, partial [Effrenium voratum]
EKRRKVALAKRAAAEAELAARRLEASPARSSASTPQEQLPLHPALRVFVTPEKAKKAQPESLPGHWVVAQGRDRQQGRSCIRNSQGARLLRGQGPGWMLKPRGRGRQGWWTAKPKTRRQGWGCFCTAEGGGADDKAALVSAITEQVLKGPSAVVSAAAAPPAVVGAAGGAPAAVVSAVAAPTAVVSAAGGAPAAVVSAVAAPSAVAGAAGGASATQRLRLIDDGAVVDTADDVLEAVALEIDEEEEDVEVASD